MEDADAFAIGPGLGRSREVRDLVERVLIAWAGPVVVDADALNVFENDSASLAKLLHGRPAVITPHPMEFARLIGRETNDVLKNRFEIAADVARDSGASVLLKGAPTIIFAPEGNRFISAAGTAALATGGSGDVLTGIVGTMLAQLSGDRTSAEVAAIAAFVHGRAAELSGPVRGTTLEDILLALPDAWNEQLEQQEEPVLACIPPVP
jgi:NAD(P)H-hydrate epimerase